MRMPEIITVMRSAWEWSKLSKGKRLKVGAIARLSSGIIIPGYNGDPIGGSNVLEHTDHDGFLVTKPSVIHAEENCILKAAKTGLSMDKSTVFITHSPCEHCSAQLINVGVAQVYFTVNYRSDDGIKLLEHHGITVTRVPYEDLYNV